MPIESDGAWIFLSHSHKDVESVMRLRNALEARGHHPLMFFLRCIDDDSELDDLIKREIKARTWFILCDSPNSRASKWVRREVEIINALPENVRRQVDLTIPHIEDQLKEVGDLLKRATVFISYHRRDEAVAAVISEVLREHDFAVWDMEQTATGEDFLSAIETAVGEAAAHGFVLVLMSSESSRSLWVRKEVELALKHGSSNIIPIALSGLVPEFLEGALADKRTFNFTSGTIRENAEALVAELKRRPMESDP